jgi:hypothetical protein
MNKTHTLFLILILSLPLVLGAQIEDDRESITPPPPSSIFTLEAGVQFYDGTYTYTLDETKTFTSLEVEDDEFYIDGLAFCNSSKYTYFTTSRSCENISISNPGSQSSPPPSSTPSSDSSTSETSTPSGSSDNDDYVPPQIEEPPVESFLDSILINPTKAAIAYFQESPQNKITSISGMLITILAVYFVSINFSTRKEFKTSIHSKYIDIETKTYGKTKK